MNDTALNELLQRLQIWHRDLDDFVPPPAMPNADGLFELRLRLVNLRRRLRDGAEAPLRIAFFGPTGAGKSKLFSSLIGKCLSESGFKRPFTRRSLYYVHDAWRPLMPALAGEVEVHEDERWRDTILIDTPDFDSVETENRREAERVFMESDGFLFVTDSLKYADASTWEYLTKIRIAGKVFRVILNKTSSPTVSETFRQRFMQTFSASPEEAATLPSVMVPEMSLRDDELIDSDHESIKKLLQITAELIPQRSAELSLEMFERESTGLFETAERLLEDVRSRRQQVEELKQRLEDRVGQSRRRLEDRLASGLEPEVREEVFERIVARLEKIDVLRYPRKLLSMPVRGLKTLVTGWWGSDESKAEAEQSGLDSVATETMNLLESELIRFADESRLDIISQEGLEKLLDRQAFRRLRLEHAEIETAFSAHQELFQEWVQLHAKETASEITNENKAKFILSQVLFNSVIITAQVSTGGLSPLELGVDGVLSPFVAKAVSTAIGNEKVKEFELAAHVAHEESMSEIIVMAKARFAEYLASLTVGLDKLEETAADIVARKATRPQLVRYFQDGASA